ncbi:m023.5L [Myxoma virus]|uniref:M023.5L n=1 Tax=Myxoma virus TaxID=10273 RepID=B2CWC9_9POXV|nr:m023.5L [Myxoma virus]ACB28816.1 m023.5L [recombinant virus 6918VP60-T2]
MDADVAVAFATCATILGIGAIVVESVIYYFTRTRRKKNGYVAL